MSATTTHGTRVSRGEGELEQQWFTQHRYAVSCVCQQWLRRVALPEIVFEGTNRLAVCSILHSKHYVPFKESTPEGFSQLRTPVLLRL